MPVPPKKHLLDLLSENGGPPPIQGVGVSEPQHVISAIEAGAKGVISGSCVILQIASDLEKGDAGFKALKSYLKSMKEVTKLRLKAA